MNTVQKAGSISEIPGFYWLNNVMLKSRLLPERKGKTPIGLFRSPCGWEVKCLKPPLLLGLKPYMAFKHLNF